MALTPPEPTGLLARLQARAHDPARAADSPDLHPHGAASVLDLRELIELERQLGGPFPPPLRQLYSEVGNGGYGPGYGLLTAQDAVERSRAWLKMYAEPPEHQLLPLAYWGCTVYSVMELGTGRVGILDLDAVEPQLPPLRATTWQRASLDAWLLAWLDGADLFGEDQFSEDQSSAEGAK